MIDFLKTIFGPLTDLLGASLQTFHDLGAPWWLSIVILTVLVRALLFPLTVKQVKNMRKMQELKPDMDRIRDEHKQDPKKQQEALMKLYAERQVTPLGGFLPLLIQMPVFIALYYTIKHFELLESFRSGGLLWFKDLTVADPYYALPVLYVLTMMASQEITLRRTASQQKHLMRILPIAFGFFLHAFPSGLFVYWVSSNVITFVQNYVIYRGSPPAAITDKEAEETSAPTGDSPGAEDSKQGTPSRQKSARSENRSNKSRKRRKKSAAKRR